MKTVFLIESKGTTPVHDFGFTMMEAVKYHQWYYGKDSPYSLHFIENDMRPDSESFAIAQVYLQPMTNKVIPVGSIGFTEKFMKLIYGVKLKPINIPQQLCVHEFLKRNTSKVTMNEPWSFAGKGFFIKDIGMFKGYTDFSHPDSIVPKGTYLISDPIDIISEYRCFVYSGELVGIHYYSGDFTVFPQVETIQDMIEVYTDCPKAYSLDVAVAKTADGINTVLIEVHDIFSCGLYGFSDFNLLTKMYVSWHNECMEKKVVGRSKTFTVEEL